VVPGRGPGTTPFSRPEPATEGAAWITQLFLGHRRRGHLRDPADHRRKDGYRSPSISYPFTSPTLLYPFTRK